jgi:hypothetical protein
MESDVRFLFLIFLSMWAVSSMAVEVKGLYASEVDVASQGLEDRNGAIRSALAEILVRITGRRDIRSEPAVQELMKNGPRYVRQYSYREEKSVEDESAGVPAQRKLRVKFDSFALNEALAANGIAVWSEDRPSILAWVAVESGKRRYLVESERQPKLTALFQKAAEKRGLPLLLPLMDLVDQSAISFNDIWGNFDDRIGRASTRYGADTILTGRLLKKTASRWTVEWTLYQQSDDVLHWSSKAGSASEALAQGVDGVFDLLAEKQVIGAALVELEQHELRVSGIKELADFSWLAKQIKGISLVEEVKWSELSGDSALFSLTIKGDEEALRQALDSIDHLFFVVSGEGDEKGELLYKLEP